MAKKIIKFPCIVFKQGNYDLVFFSAKASVLWDILEINRRIEDKDEGYQRALSPSRVKSIARYIDANNPLPISILVSFDEAKLNKDKNELIVPNKNDAGWVIDGQHRLAGSHIAKHDIVIPVIAFTGLDIEGQIQEFVTINREAKGVPTSLYYDLLKYLPTKKPSEIAKERSADIATELKKDENSPFFNKIVITTAPRRGQLSLTNFVRKFTPLILDGKGIFHIFTAFEQNAIINNYYISLRNVFPKQFNRLDSIFFQTLGFGALMNALPKFFSICLRDNKGFTAADATKIFNEINHFNFDDWYKKGTGSAAEIEAGNDLQTELSDAFEIVSDKDRGRSLRI